MKRFLPGIDRLLSVHGDLVGGRRIALLTHAAALASSGASSAELLATSGACRLTSIMAPEHGFFGAAGAGAPVRTIRHPVWGIPVHSLYGEVRGPTPAMLRAADVVVCDLQDLGARPYTYVSTLRLVLEAAAAQGLPVVVADRPVPLPRIADGPMLEAAFESFVGSVRTPMHYGMTPGETALWLRADLGLDLDLRVAPMQGYGRDGRRGPDWPPWSPPSPGIRSWESAACYLATVFTEAVPTVSCGRTTALPFQVFGAPWIRSQEVRDALDDLRLPGAAFFLHPFVPTADPYAGRLIDGVRIVVRDPARFRPVLISAAILHVLQRLYGPRRLWAAPGARPGFFDKLYGTDAVRLALRDGATPADLARAWEQPLRRFRRSRAHHLLYPA